MARAGAYLAAGAIAAALVLAGGGGAVAAADTTGESAGSDSTTNGATAASGTASGNTASGTASGNTASGTAASGHSVEPNTLSSSGNAKSADDQADKDKAGANNGGEVKDPAPDQSGQEPVEKKPVNKDPGTNNSPGDKTINRAPLRPEAPPPLELTPLPEAPPPADLAPLPIAPLAPALGTPPPADLPPTIPATPVDPDTVDAIDGESGHRPGGNEPPVLTVPILVARAPIPPQQILGSSIESRWTSSGTAVEPTPGWSGKSSPPLVRASSEQRPMHEPWLSEFNLTAREQIPYRTGYGQYSSRALARTAAEALPGVAGLVMMTATGICLGYRQAKTAQQLRLDDIDRFVS